MESTTTIADLSQSFLQSNPSLPKKKKPNDKFLSRFPNKFRNFFHWMRFPLCDDELRSTMKKIGLVYRPRESFSYVDFSFELEAYYIFLIEVLFKEKILTFSKEKFQKDYIPIWNQKFLELYYSCTESELAKIAFLVTHPLVSIKGLEIGCLGVITENLRIIFARNSPNIDICSLAASHWKTNPFLAEIEKPGYIEERIKPIIISLSARCLTKRYFNSRFEFNMFDYEKIEEAEIVLQLVFKIFLKKEKYCKRGHFTEASVERLRNCIISFDVFSLSDSDFSDSKNCFLNPPIDRVVFDIPSFLFLQRYIDFVINVRTLLPNSFKQVC